MSDEAILTVLDFRRKVQDRANQIQRLLEEDSIPTDEMTFVALAALAAVGCKAQDMPKEEFTETMTHLFENFSIEDL